MSAHAFPFGKYKGRPISHIVEAHPRYCMWLLSLDIAEQHTAFHIELSKEVAALLLRRAKQAERRLEMKTTPAACSDLV